jgi:hypothetical protein
MRLSRRSACPLIEHDNPARFSGRHAEPFAAYENRGMVAVLVWIFPLAVDELEVGDYRTGLQALGHVNDPISALPSAGVADARQSLGKSRTLSILDVCDFIRIFGPVFRSLIVPFLQEVVDIACVRDRMRHVASDQE